MLRFILFIFILGIVIYFCTVWIIKYVASTGKAVEREEHKIWDKYDKTVNPVTPEPAKAKPVKTKKKKKVSKK